MQLFLWNHMMTQLCHAVKESQSRFVEPNRNELDSLSRQLHWLEGECSNVAVLTLCYTPFPLGMIVFKCKQLRKKKQTLTKSVFVVFWKNTNLGCGSYCRPDLLVGGNPISNTWRHLTFQSESWGAESCLVDFRDSSLGVKFDFSPLSHCCSIYRVKKWKLCSVMWRF